MKTAVKDVMTARVIWVKKDATWRNGRLAEVRVNRWGNPGGAGHRPGVRAPGRRHDGQAAVR
jgi:hypothetical protein